MTKSQLVVAQEMLKRANALHKGLYSLPWAGDSMEQVFMGQSVKHCASMVATLRYAVQIAEEDLNK